MLSVASQCWVAFTVQGRDAGHKLALVLRSCPTESRDLLLVLSRNKSFCIVKCPWKIDLLSRTTGADRGSEPGSQGIPPTRPWHSLNVPLPRVPSKGGLQHGGRPVGFAALFTTKAGDLRAVEALVEAGL